MSGTPSGGPERPRRVLSLRVQLAVLAALGLFVLGGSLLRDALGVEWSAEGVRASVESLGTIAPLGFVLFLAFRYLVMVPSPLLLVAGGLCFGAALGTVYGGIGLTLAALWQWFFVRWAGADAVRARVPARLRWVIQVARSRFGVGALALASGYPIGPVTAVQLSAAIAGTGFASFVLAVGLGSMLRAFLFSYFGSTLVTGDGLLLSSGLLLATLGGPLLVPSWRRWLLGNLREPVDATG